MRGIGLNWAGRQIDRAKSLLYTYKAVDDSERTQAGTAKRTTRVVQVKLLCVCERERD